MTLSFAGIRWVALALALMLGQGALCRGARGDDDPMEVRRLRAEGALARADGKVLDEIAAEAQWQAWGFVSHLCASGSLDAAEAFAERFARAAPVDLAGLVPLVRAWRAWTGDRSAAAAVGKTLRRIEFEYRTPASRAGSWTLLETLQLPEGVPGCLLARVERVRALLANALGKSDRVLAAHETLLPLVRALGWRELEAMTLAMLGGAYGERGRVADAHALFDRGMELARERRAPAQEAYYLALHGDLDLDVGAPGSARAYYDRALTVGGSALPAGEATMLHAHRGRARFLQGDHEGAVSDFEVALRGLSAGESPERTDALIELGTSLTFLYRREAADEALGQAVDLSRAAADPGRRIRALLALATGERLRGELGAAQARIEQAAEVARSAGDGGAQAGVQVAQAMQAFAFGELSEAAKLANSALLNLSRLNLLVDPKQVSALRAAFAGQAHVLLLLGKIAFQQGQLDLAITRHERARKLLASHGDAPPLATALSLLGAALGAAGRHQEALERLGEALAMQRRLGDRLGEAEARLEQGQALVRSGQLEAGLTALAEAESLGAARPDLVALARTLRARALLAAGRAADALGVARHGVDGLSPLLRWHADASAAGVRQEWRSLYDVGARAALASGSAAQAFRFVEEGRAGALLESLGGPSGVSGALVPAELLSNLALVASRERGLAAASPAPSRGDASAPVPGPDELEAARDALSAALARVEAAAKRGSSLAQTSVLALSEAQAALGPSQAYVALVAGDETGDGQAFALVVTREQARAVDLGPAASLRQAGLALVEAAEGEGPAPDVGPLVGRVVTPLNLPEALDDLLISTDSALLRAPWSLLLPGRAVTLVPSLTVWHRLRERRRTPVTGVLALGEPLYPPARRALPASGQEARAVGDVVLTGTQATESGLRAALASRPRWRALHLACHAVLDRRNALFSSLALSPASPGDDGEWTCLEVLRTPLSVELVVLSGCETARGRTWQGESAAGLTRAFLVAGAASVLSSLWTVDDEATSALMQAFHAAWNPRDGSAPLPAARALLRAQDRVRSEPRWAHPRFWAGWVLTG